MHPQFPRAARRPRVGPALCAVVLFSAGAGGERLRDQAQGSRPEQIEPDQRLALGTALGLPQTHGFDISPDGRRAVLAVTIGRNSLLFLAAAGAAPGELTSGRRWDSAPRFAGDDLTVVFVSGRRPGGADRETGRLFRLRLGEEPAPLTGAELAARAPAVSPDGTRVAFVARGENETDDGDPATGEDLWLVPVSGGEPRRLTAHSGDEGPPVWSPDGRRLAYTFAVDFPEGDRGLAILEVSAERGAEPLVLASGSPAARGIPDWIPDGSGLAFAGAADCPPECEGGGHDSIYFVEAAGDAPPVRLLARERDLAEPRFRPGLAEETLEIAWVEADRGNRRIHRSGLDRGEDGVRAPVGRVRVVTRGAGVTEELRWTRDGAKLAALHEAPAFPRDVWLFPAAGGRERISDTLFPEMDVRSFSRPERIESESADGVTVGAFLYRATGEAAGEAPFDAPREMAHEAPLLVHLQGHLDGMAGEAWRNGFDPIVQLFTGRGYAVLVPNVRGTAGRGAAFAALNDGDWGGGDLDDLVAATRAARTLPGVSPDEACVFGIGYGGFLALAALARHPEFFACGIEAMGTADLLRLHRSLDPERRAAVERELGPLRGNLATYRRLSLTGEGAAVEAPLLSFHGEVVPESPLAAKEEFLNELRSRPRYPLVELFFRGDSGRAVFRWDTDRGAAYAFFTKIIEFLSLHLPTG